MILADAPPELHQRLGDELAKAAIATLTALRAGAGATDFAKFRALRLELASLCLEIPQESLQPAWISLKELRTAQVMVAMFDMPRAPREDELLDRIRAIMRGGGFVNPITSAVIAGMLLANAYELPPLTNFEYCPIWLLDGYLEFLFESPNIFQRPGDVSRYGDFLEALLTGIWASVEQGEISPLQRHILVRFLQWSNFVQANFLDRNVRNLFATRARILETTLELGGCQLNHAFRRRTAVPDRIRLGILTQGMAPSTETFHNLAYFEHLDRSIFEVSLYVFQETKHPLEDYCRSCSDRFVLLPKDDLSSQVARIRSDDLDVILIGNNITVRGSHPSALAAAHRLARLQVALMDSPVTTGFRNMDVMLSAEWNEPLLGAAEQYTEQLCKIEGSINCYAYEHDRNLATVCVTRADLKCDSSSVLYFSGANCYKIIPELSETWATILAAVPDSALVLMPFNPNWSSSYAKQPFIDRFHAQLAAYGVGPERLRVIGCLPTRADVHSVMQLCDVYLDSYPFAGACSFLDAVTVGLPTVAWHGKTARTRHGLSILGSMGLDHLAAANEEEYVRKAVEFGSQPALRQQARASITAATRNTPPVLDTKDFGARIGSALRSEFESYVRQSNQLLQTGEEAIPKIANSIQISGKRRALQITDQQITEHLIQPYLRGMRCGEPGHIVDVGACYGQISSTFLRDGWTADLFEPDGGAREVLQRQLASVAAQYRLFPFAVSDRAQSSTQFYRASQHGLSGFNATSYGPIAEVSTVQCVRLGDFLAEQGVQQIDFLKVDTEGWDFEVLAGHDFERLRPTIVFVEYGAERQRPKLIPVLDQMHLRGYHALLFHFTDDGNFQKGIWQTRLLSVLPGDRAGELPPDSFGNIVFYPSNESLFPVATADLLTSFER